METTKQQISKFFTLEEMVRSESATRKGIDNTPTAEAIANITMLCLNVLDPLEKKIGSPLFVSSGFRCLKLNTAIGGSKNSQHMAGTTNGKTEAAADLESKLLTVEELYQFIKSSGIRFDQLIQEFGSWVHVSWTAFPRGMCLRAIKEGGKTVYQSDGTV